MDGSGMDDQTTDRDATIVAHAPLTRRRDGHTDTRRHTEDIRETTETAQMAIWSDRAAAKTETKTLPVVRRYSQRSNAEQRAECVVGQVTDLVIIQ